MTKILEAVQAGSGKWKAAFNAGDAAACAACYEPEAVMVAKPFGEFVGRDAIETFWRTLIADGYTNIEYLEPTVTVIDETSAVLQAGWTMNKAKGVITRELWVLQDSGEALLREDHFEAHGA